MRKGVLVLVLLALALVVAGCQGGKSAVSSSSTPFIGGSEGLRMSFLPNAPPAEVFDNGQTFDITLRVENVGERPINNLKVTVGGIYPADFNLQKPIQPFAQLEGVSKDPDGGRIPGGINDVQFAKLAYKGKLEGNTEFPIQVDACYSYKTVAVSDICLRKNLITPTPGVCQIKGSRRVFNSGSPVQIVSVDESLGGNDKVVLKFVIKAVGAGSYFQLGSGCKKGDLQTESFVNVAIDAGLSGGLQCSGWSGASQVRLTNGEASITCIQTLSESDKVDAIKPIKVTMDYDHSISTSTKLLVKHLPGIAATPPGTPAPQPQDVNVLAALCQNGPGTWNGPYANPPCKCVEGKVWTGSPGGCLGQTCSRSSTPKDCSFQVTTNVKGQNRLQGCPGILTCTDQSVWSNTCADKNVNDYCPVTDANYADVVSRCKDLTSSKGTWNEEKFACDCPSDRVYQWDTGRCDIMSP